VADDPDDDVITKAFAKIVEDAVERGVDPHTLENAAAVAFQQSADHLRGELKRRAQGMLEEYATIRLGFETRLYERWKTGLDLFEMILVSAHEAGNEFSRRHSKRAGEQREFRFLVRTRLHARACCVGWEVLTLLRTGYAAAAMSRWRALHEISVVMSLVKEHGEDLAERYYLHQDIESAKAAEEYQQHHSRLGLEPLSPEEIQDHRSRRAELLQRFGDSYKSQYGWASVLLHNRSPKIEHLEEATGLDHMRPYYRMASHGVHGNPKGIIFQLGDMRTRRILLAGASNAGLADPGHAALISLLQCTVSLLNTAVDPKGVILLHVMSDLVGEAGQAFLASHKQLALDEETFQTENAGENTEDMP
jgi:hypothetical protein